MVIIGCYKDFFFWVIGKILDFFFIMGMDDGLELKVSFYGLKIWEGVEIIWGMRVEW